jgi:REP element-mobilizing transposase RayT
MPRKPRDFAPGVALHVTRRGHNRTECFFTQEDRALYLSLLVRLAVETRCRIHAYVLMSNHVHLLLTPHAPESCANLMKNLGQNHVQRINSRRGRTGTLWEGRFWSCPVTAERYVLACYRYVELNPPRAGMFARGEFELGPAAALTLPQTAVVQREGFAYAYRVDGNGRVAQTKIGVGRRVGDRIEVTQGLEPDTQVVASGTGFLADGDLVRVVPAGPVANR